MAVLEKSHITVHVSFENKKELFQAIAENAKRLGIIKSEEEFVEGLFLREEEISTGFERGIAIPHTLNDTVIEPAIFIVKTDEGIKWDEEGKTSDFIICLAIPKDKGNTHIKLLSSVARKLVDEEFVDKVLSLDSTDEIYECFADVIRSIE